MAAKKIRLRAPKGGKILWFADKRLGTCYRVAAIPLLGDGLRFWITVHNESTQSLHKLGVHLFTERGLAYSGLIGSLNDDIEELTKRIRRAALEIA